MRFYGHLRPVHDLDLVVDCDEENVQRIKASLEALDAIRTDEVPSRLRGGMKQIVKWNDTELWSSNFDRPYQSLAGDAAEVQIGGAAGLLISRAHLAEAKHKAAHLPQRDKRGQDLADLEYLRRDGGISV